MSGKILWYLNPGPDIKNNWKQTPIDVVLEKISANEESKPFLIAWTFEDIGKPQLIDTIGIKFIMEAIKQTPNATGHSDTENNNSLGKDNNKLSHEKQINSNDEESSEEKQKTNDPINALTISTLIVSLISLITLLIFIFIGKPNDSDTKSKIEELKLIAENLKSEMETKTNGLKSISNNLNTAKTNVNASVESLNKYLGEINSALKNSSQNAMAVATIAQQVKDSLTDLNTNTFAKIGDLKNFTDAKLFNEKFTTILEGTLSTENLAKIIIEKDNQSGQKFIGTLTTALLQKDPKKIEDLKKIFAENLGKLDTESRKTLMTEIIKSYSKPTADERSKLTKELLIEWINKAEVQASIAQSVISKNQKVVIIPIQDIHPTSGDGMFNPLIKQLLNTEHKIFIYSNDKLTEINQANISELKKNFNNTTSVVDSDFYKESVKATDNKSSDIILIRGPNSPVAPKIDGSAWFNGNHCSVIYINNKTSPTNDSDERKIQWANLVTINRGSLRIVDFDSTKPDETDKTVAQILKEIKEVR